MWMHDVKLAPSTQIIMSPSAAAFMALVDSKFQTHNNALTTFTRALQKVLT